jgi:archaellum component FlaD/FlaE
MADSSKDASAPRKIIDVTAPGKSAPSPSAKSIIVTSRPMMRQDPMMANGGPTDEAQPAEETQPAEALAGTGKTIKVQAPIDTGGSDAATPTAPLLPKGGVRALKVPVSLNDAKDETPQETPQVPTTEPQEDAQNTERPLGVDITELSKKEEAATAEVPAEAEKTPQPDKPVTEPVPDSEAAKPELKEDTGNAQLTPKEEDDEAKRKEEERKVARAAELEKIVESKQYFLPVNAVERRRDLRLVTILLLVLAIAVALIWFDLLLDAGLVKIDNVHALTHFFNS